MPPAPSASSSRRAARRHQGPDGIQLLLELAELGVVRRQHPSARGELQLEALQLALAGTQPGRSGDGSATGERHLEFRAAQIELEHLPVEVDFRRCQARERVATRFQVFGQRPFVGLLERRHLGFRLGKRVGDAPLLLLEVGQRLLGAGGANLEVVGDGAPRQLVGDQRGLLRVPQRHGDREGHHPRVLVPGVAAGGGDALDAGRIRGAARPCAVIESASRSA